MLAAPGSVEGAGSLTCRDLALLHARAPPRGFNWGDSSDPAFAGERARDKKTVTVQQGQITLQRHFI